MTLFDTDIDNQIHETFINDLIKGSGVSGGKERIHKLFNRNISKTETIELLKDEYGIGGRSVTGYSQWHDSKGIRITLDKTEDGRLKVIGEKLYTWNQVHDALSNLINNGEYLEGDE